MCPLDPDPDPERCLLSPFQTCSRRLLLLTPTTLLSLQLSPPARVNCQNTDESARNPPVWLILEKTQTRGEVRKEKKGENQNPKRILRGDFQPFHKVSEAYFGTIGKIVFSAFQNIRDHGKPSYIQRVMDIPS
ncbi:unnamed protein product [Microthlaspi erraticum]|uniref:Uncharacterized protein n=1 Tax=Microthlaspi erraticum TaxID=1685480 RepID=A0A6D2HVL5_9BRAS|nr:unnamed protein product [Microthlaspi erraticum]